MNLQNLKLKASTLCAGGTLLVFGGFLTVNLAGCGGGKGGLTTIPTPSPVGATFRIVQQDSTPSKGGTLTLTGNGRSFSGTAGNDGVLVLNNVSPGTYTATFTSFTSNGTALPSTSRQLTITRVGAQNFVLVQGDTGNGAFTLTGTIFQNPNNSDFTNCTTSSSPVTAAVLISVRDLNDTTGAPIIAQIVRPLQDSNVAVALKGRYTISVPTNPRSFRVEVGPADNNGAAFAGISATTTFTQGTTSLSNVNVCANSNGKIPVPFSPTATPTVTPTGGAFPIASTTPTSTATADPNATATQTPGPTSTSLPTATPTQPGATTGNGATPLPNVATGGTTGTTTTGTTTTGTTTTGTTTTGTTAGSTAGNTTINNTALGTSGSTTAGSSAGNTTINNTALGTAGSTTAGSSAGNTTNVVVVTPANRRRR